MKAEINIRGYMRFIFLLLGFMKGINPAGYCQNTDSIDILHYGITLDVTAIAAKNISGSTNLAFTASIPAVDGISLELLELNVDSVLLNGVTHPFTYNDTLIRVLFAVPLNPGDTGTLSVFYHGVPHVEPSGWGGFHFSGSSLAYNLGIAISEIPHNFGRVWFPCIDNFTERASYDYYITVPSGLTAVCGGTLLSVAPGPGNTSIFHWKMEEEIPAYLASLAISNYIPVTGTYNGITDTIPTYIYVKPQDTTKAKNSFIHLNSILATFESRFGPYRWPRVGYVSTPIGAMEHATNIAYPTNSINGLLSDEWLYAHELSHSWFGDLITCSSPYEMWINEGWAVFCESIMKEGVYGKAAYKDNIRAKLHEVLQLTHITDNGYRAVYGIPLSLTYGSTVYDKGGTVVHTLRGYLGDSLFFNAVKAMVDSFAFRDISSQQMRDFLSWHTGISMNDFFDAWVFRPGFPHFACDSFSVQQNGVQYDVTVFMRQKLKGVSTYASSNRVQVQFLGQNWQRETRMVQFSGHSGSQMFTLSFPPLTVITDPEEKLGDASTDVTRVVKTGGSYTFPDTYFSCDVSQVNDSALVHVVHHWVAPDSLNVPVPGLTLSNYRYWSVEGLFTTGLILSGKFSYSKFNYLDNTLITNNLDSLILLYREGPADQWHSINHSRNGSPYQGELIVDDLRPGEYTLAIWDHNYIGLDEVIPAANLVIITPNPGNEMISIRVKEVPSILRFTDMSGRLIECMSVEIPDQEYTFRAPSPGQYMLTLLDRKGKLIERQKVICY